MGPYSGNTGRPWVFFDIGNVMFYDLSLLARIWKHFYLILRENGLVLSFEEVLRERELLLAENPPEINPRRIIAEKHAGHIDPAIVDRAVDQWLPVYYGSNYPVSGIHKALDVMKDRYNLGIIANQPPAAVQELSRLGLEGYFRHMTISDVVGYHKPDLRIFRHALNSVDAKASECLMVGDRMDNDVMPAKTVGMKAIWLDLNHRLMEYRPADEYERLYIESYLKITGINQDQRSPGLEPDYIIKSLSDLPRAVDSLMLEAEVLK